MVRLVRLLLILLLVVFWARAADAADAADGVALPTLVFPLHKAFITKQTVRLIGLAPETSSTVSLQVKGGQLLGPNPVPVTRGGFTAEVELAHGTNTITVLDGAGQVVSAIEVAYGLPGTAAPAGFTAYSLHNGKVQTADCTECHVFSRRGSPSYKRINPISPCTTSGCHGEFGRAKFVHGPVAGKTCTGCHNPHGSFQPDFLSRKGALLCYACHTAEEERFATGVVHAPVRQGECTTCHDPHQSDLQFHLKGKSLQDLCASCHGSEQTKHRFLHGPVGTGDCVACHNPHASEVKGLLYEEGAALCFLCHKDRQEEFQRKFVHKPAAEGCGICHDPHGSEVRFQLRGVKIKESVGQTSPCLSCHQKLNPELAKQILNAKVAHPPVRDGKCTACHTPHSTDYRYQLKAPQQEICFSCHMELGDDVREALFKHGPVVSNDCGECHQVHGSDFPKLLVNDFPSEFYTPYATNKYKICFDCHNERVALDKWSKETQFRNGNRNLHYVHVNQRKGRSCKACHAIHGGNQTKHIRDEVPFGKGWSYPITYTSTDTGGTCAVGCHKPLSYDRENPVKYW